jgi:hypothetical protein
VRALKKTGKGKGMGTGRDAYNNGKNHLIGSGSAGLGKSATSCRDTYDLISNSDNRFRRRIIRAAAECNIYKILIIDKKH